MEVSRYVNLTYAIGFIICFVVFEKALTMVWQAMEQLPDLSIVGSTITLTDALAAAIAIGFAIWAYKNDEWRTYVSEVVVELKKVTWPTAEETKRHTIVVIVFTVIVSVFLFGMDRIWSYLTDLILVSGS